MKAMIRRWLGLDQLDQLSLILTEQRAIRDELLLLRNDLTVTFKDEFDPGRLAMSKRLGARVIERLVAEDKARRHTLGEP